MRKWELLTLKTEYIILYFEEKFNSFSKFYVNFGGVGPMKCKNCGGNLDLNIKEGKLYCSHCNSIFNIDDIKESNVTFNECKYCDFW